MCRRAWVVILVVVVVMLAFRARLSSGGDRIRAEAKRAVTSAVKSAPAASITVLDSCDVVKYGKTPEAAEQLARDAARDWVVDYLAKQNPPVEWRPDADYIKQKEMVKLSGPQEVEMGEEGHKEKFYKVTATTEVTNLTFSDMKEQDRKFYSEQRKAVGRERQTLLGKILAGIVATLAAVAVYMRLDEATKGYYSLWLRLGSIALVASVGAGVWLFL